MARQSNHQKLEGTIGDITYLKLNGNYIARKKSSLDAKRIATDPAFENSRASSTEFGRVTASASFMFNALMPFTKEVTDPTLWRRLNKLMHAIKNYHAEESGLRTVAGGLCDYVCDELLTGFEFNSFSPVRRHPFMSGIVKPADGELKLTAFRPNQLRTPKGATHLILSCCYIRLDFRTKTARLFKAEESVFDLKDKDRVSVCFTPERDKGDGVLLCLLKHRFSMISNNCEYRLGGKSAGGIVVVEATMD